MSAKYPVARHKETPTLQKTKWELGNVNVTDILFGRNIRVHISTAKESIVKKIYCAEQNDDITHLEVAQDICQLALYGYQNTGTADHGHESS